jgi:hypothetical protein
VSELRPAIEMVRNIKPGTALVFRVLRGGKESDITVTIGAAPFTLLTLLD